MDRSAVTRVLAGGVAVLLLATSQLQPLTALQPRERVLYVNAFDKDTRTPVTDLGVRDFVVREDGIAREVLRVTPATSPMAIAILFDNAEASTNAIPDIRNAVTAFVKTTSGLGPTALIGYAARPTILTDYTPNTETLLAGVGRIFAMPGTGATLLDAIRETAQGLAKREEDRAAMVVLATENIEFSSLHYQQVLDVLKKSGAQLHVVMLTETRSQMRSDPALNRATVVDRGPRESGGIRWDILASSAFEGQLQNLAQVLKSQYRVIYARPESLIPPERLEVSVAKPGVEANGAPARGQAVR
jgi:hypothetical protein